jgi:hypothetical protein
MLNAVTASSLLNNLCKMENISSDFKNLENKTAWKLYSIALWEKEFNVVF